MTAHNPVAQVWECSGCGGPWPCRTRQRELTATYPRAPASLVTYMSRCMAVARVELSDVPEGALHARFLGWIRW